MSAPFLCTVLQHPFSDACAVWSTLYISYLCNPQDFSYFLIHVGSLMFSITTENEIVQILQSRWSSSDSVMTTMPFLCWVFRYWSSCSQINVSFSLNKTNMSFGREHVFGQAYSQLLRCLFNENVNNRHLSQQLLQKALVHKYIVII